MENKRFKVLTMALWLSLFNSINAYAQDLEIALDDALAMFYQSNLDLIAAQYNIDQAQAEVISAGAIPNPTLGVQIAEISSKPNMGAAASGCNHDPNVSCGVAEI
ncbi:MAG: TolC family protein, partial [Methylomonas sp.]